MAAAKEAAREAAIEDLYAQWRYEYLAYLEGVDAARTADETEDPLGPVRSLDELLREADPETFCADPEDVKRRITDRTCAIVVTHVYGNPADMDAFLEVVEGTDITLIEDASHAHGALWNGRSVGSIGSGVPCWVLK